MIWFFPRSILSQLIVEVQKMSAQLDALRDQVTRNTTVTESAITLLQGLKTALDEAISTADLGVIKQLSDSLGAETDKLAAAVTTNTPSSPPTDQPPSA